MEFLFPSNYCHGGSICFLFGYFYDLGGVKIMSDLAIKHGYYFEVDRNDLTKEFNVIIGKGYQDDDVENFSMKMEKGFLVYYINGVKETMRDCDLSKPFEEVADAFLEKIVEANTKMAVMKRVNGELVPYYSNN